MVGQTAVSNLTQIFREPIEITGTAQASATETEDQRAYQRQRKSLELQRGVESAFVFGVKSESQIDADGKRVRTMDGLLAAIQTNVVNQGGALGINELNSFTQKAFANGSQIKFAFAGSTVLQAIHAIFQGKLQVTSGETAVGLQVARVITPHGTLLLIHNSALRDGFADHMIVVDPADARIRELQGRGIRLRTDIQNDGDDSIIDEWAAELTLDYGSEQTHSILKGVTGAA